MILSEVPRAGALSGNQSWCLELLDEHLLSGKEVVSMTPTKDGRMAIGYFDGGIELFGVDGSQGIALRESKVVRVSATSQGQYVVRDKDNGIKLYTNNWERTECEFSTLDNIEGSYGGLAVRGDRIYAGYWLSRTIQVFNIAGGLPLGEIPCHGYEPWDIYPMSHSELLVVRAGSTVTVIDPTGTVKYDVRKDDARVFPTVLKDDTILIASVDKDGLLNIELYTPQLKFIRRVLDRFPITLPFYAVGCLGAFSTGEIVFCSSTKFLIFGKKDDNPVYDEF